MDDVIAMQDKDYTVAKEHLIAELESLLSKADARIVELSGGLHAALELIEEHQLTLEDNRVWGEWSIKLKQKAERALFRPVTADTP